MFTPRKTLPQADFSTAWLWPVPSLCALVSHCFTLMTLPTHTHTHTHTHTEFLLENEAVTSAHSVACSPLRERLPLFIQRHCRGRVRASRCTRSLNETPHLSVCDFSPAACKKPAKDESHTHPYSPVNPSLTTPLFSCN